LEKRRTEIQEGEEIQTKGMEHVLLYSPKETRNYLFGEAMACDAVVGDR
jgi:hypothetical protein